jgi:anti-sigma B factor antagonist
MPEDIQANNYRFFVESAGSTQVVSLSGFLDKRCQQAKADFGEIIDTQPERIVVDMTQVTYLSSAGLALLVTVHSRCRKQGVQLSLAGMTPDSRELFRVTRLDKVLDIHDALEDAIA